MEAPASPVVTARAAVPRFDAPNVLWYFGAIAATIASIAVITEVGSQHRGLWIFIVALAFTGAAAGLSAFALRFGCWVPGGVMAAATVALFPTVVVGFDHLIGVWPKYRLTSSPFRDFGGVPFTLVLLTVLAGLVAFWLMPFGFVLFPVAVAAVLAVQWLLPVFVTGPSSDDNAIALIITGGAYVVIGMLLDARNHRAPAFWWHVLGLFAIADGLVYYVGRFAIEGFLPNVAAHRSSWPWVTMLVLGVALVLASFPVRRATWAVFGVLGIYAPSLHYIDESTGSWRFPLVMAFVGVGLVFLGAVLDVFGTSWWQRVARPVVRPPE